MPKLNLHYSVLLKCGIALVCVIFLYQRVCILNLHEFEHLFNTCLKANSVFLGAAMVLIFFNWGVETIKWQYLMRSIEKLSFIKAFSAILAGVAVSSFTPNRVGEFAGRILLLKNKMDGRAVTLTIIGGMSQFLMTLGLGIPGFLFFLIYSNGSALPHMGWIIVASVLLLSAYALLFWNLQVLFRKIKKRFFKFKVIQTISDAASMINKKGLRYITFLSFCRYLIFLVQYILVLLFFEVYMEWWCYLMIIPAIYLVQSVVPSFALTDIGVRLTVAVTLLSFVVHSDTSIMAASALLWIINLMLPASAGALIILFAKFKHSK